MTNKKNTNKKNDQNGYTINELLTVNQLLSRCTNDKEIKNSITVLSTVRITIAIDKIQKEFFEEREALFTVFNVDKATDEQGHEYYNYASHTEKDKIDNALKESTTKLYEIADFNKIDEDDFVVYTRGLSHQEIAFLYSYLVKK